MFEKDPLVNLLLVLTAFQAVALVAAWAVLRRREPRPLAHGRVARALDRLAALPPAALALVFAVSFSLSAALAAAHWPIPRIQDDFSYRLAGETLASGRLTNPPHPMWPHFETEHILHQPSYMSKYPPMQGLSLAAGHLLAGEPMVGVWLGLAAASAAVCWMFYGFLPARWALVGGLLVATHPWLQAWWGHSAWGGQTAMLGGALLFGAVRRIAGGDHGPLRLHWGVLVGVGVAILANSRPYEGLLASLPAAAVLAWHTLGPRRPRLLDSLTRIILPAAAVLALAGAAMAAYNHRVSGDPLTLPYLLHTQQYGATPMFIWQDLPPEPEYRDRKLSDFYAGWERSLAIRQHSVYGAARKALHKIVQFGGFYFGPALGLAAMGLVLAGPRRGLETTERRWLLFAAAAAAWTLAGSLLCVWFNPHYVAPIAPLALLLAVAGLRQWAASGTGRPATGAGGRLAAALAAAHFATALALLPAAAAIYPTDDWSHTRARIISDLTATGEKHLIILRHGREYAPHEEWVYNAADIDASPVVWARELDSAAARELREHYKDRRHWLLEAYRPALPDGTPPPVPRPVPYPELPEWLHREPLRLLVGEAVGAVLAADLDGDGKAEVVAASVGRPVLEVFRGPGLRDRLTLPLPAPASALAVVDASGSRPRRIIATLAGRSELVEVVMGDAGAEVVRTVTLPSEARGVAVVPGEEIAVVSCFAPSGVAVVRMGSETPKVEWIPLGDELHSIVSADVSRDGIADVVASDRVGGVVWVLPGRRSEDGAWGVGPAERLASVPEPLGLAAVDLGDGAGLWIAFASADRDEVALMRPGGPEGTLTKRLNTGVVPIAVAPVDVDAGGGQSLAVATRFGHGLTVLRRLGTGEFAAPAEVTLGTRTWHVDKAARIAAGDVDGDGIGDVVVGAADGVYVFVSGKDRKRPEDSP